jgi:hypothetical protein
VQQVLTVSEHRTCWVLGQPRSTQRRTLVVRDDEEALTRAIVDLAGEYGRYGYHRITHYLGNKAGTSTKNVSSASGVVRGRKCRRNKRNGGCLWLNDGSCVRRRPQCRHHVWSYDFVIDRTLDGQAFRILTVIDEYSRECLAIRAERR